MSTHTEAPQELCYRAGRKNCREHSYTRLPFVNIHDDDRTRTSDFWDVPSVGGITGGDITGRAMALAYLRHVEFEDPDELDNFLGGIVHAMVAKLALLPPHQFTPGKLSVNDPRTMTLRAQMSGFMDVIEMRGARGLPKRKHIRKLTEEQILDMANKGLAYDDEAGAEYWETRTRLDQQESQFHPEPIPNVYY